MMKKIFVLWLIVCSFFIVSISPVLVAEEQDVTITDPMGDVADYYSGENVTSSPTINIKNIDIKEVTYSRQGQKVTLTLAVYGNIQDMGNIDDAESGIGENYILYLILVSTSDELYSLYYVNKHCRIAYQDFSSANISDFNVSGSDLIISFNLLNNTETYDSIEATTEYYNVADDNDEDLFDDAAPATIELNVNVSAPSEGEIGQNIQFAGSQTGAQSEINWTWDFGDDGIGYGQNPSHVYDSIGNYEVILYVSDANSNWGYSTFNITISESGTSDGGSGDNNGGSSDYALLLFAAIIAIIVIVGVIVVIFIIRR